MLPVDISRISRFLDEYSTHVRATAARRQAHDLDKTDAFLQEYKVFLGRHEALARVEAPEFNVFRILNIGRYEEKTHTPILHNLLDVMGSHGQRALFYKQFLKQVLPTEVSRFDTPRVRATQEHWMGNGEIDIFIESLDPAKPFCLVIENKIDAGDQSQQLQRYYDFVTQQLGYSDDQVRLLYLTKYGDKPSDFSMATAEQTRLINAGVLHILSYRKHILNFIKASRELVQAEPVRYLLQQYQQLIKTL
jgi:hypothetical protein